MPSVSINCPACKRALKPAEDPPPGARMRCPYSDCGTVFHYDPAANGPREEKAAWQVAPPDDGAEYDVMTGLLAEDQPVAPRKQRHPALDQDLGAAGEPASSPGPMPVLPRLVRSRSGSKIRQPVAGHPLAQASERSKEVLIGGKGVKFDEPRKYMGVLIGFLVLVGLYGGFLAFSAFWRYYNNAAKHRADSVAGEFKKAEETKKQRLAAAAAKLTPEQDAPAGKAGPAGKAARAGKVAAAGSAAPAVPASTAHLTVTVESARQGAFFPPDQRQFLEIKLLIKNESKVASHIAGWNGPEVVARLHGTGFVPYQLHAGPAQNAKIKSGQSIRETLYFERTVPGHELTLDLTIPGMPPQKLTIAANAVQR